ncbi:MAG: F0F1 ATP synthase subunit B [Planctomycetota bacterium]
MSKHVIQRTALWTGATLLLLAGPALAAEEGHGESPSIFTGDLGNIIWTLVTFIAVVIVLGKFAWKPILAALQKREEFIRDSLAEAKKDRQETEAKLKQIEERLHAARDDAAAIVEEGRRDGEVVKRKAHQDAGQEAEAMLERAKREIGLARDTAVKELYDLTARLATEAASRIIDKELDAKEHERLIAESIDQLAARGGNGNS